MMNLMNKWSRENTEEPMAIAADSLVHFTEGVSPLQHQTADEDGLIAAEVARAVEICMHEVA